MNMTPRARTYFLKKHGIKIDHAEPFNSDCDYWFVEFSDGTTIHARNIHTYKPFDGKAACEREARQIATEKKVETLLKPAWLERDRPMATRRKNAD